MNRNDHDVDRLREALQGQVEILDDGAACYPADVLWDSAAGRRTTAEDRSLILHLGECTACATSWELARELAPLPAASAKPLSTPVHWPGLAAAAALVILLIGLWVWQPAVRQPATYRDTSGDWIVAGPAEGQTLARESAVLSWSAGPPGTTYDVYVTAADLTPLARGLDLGTPNYRIDPTALAELERGEEILWRVTARMPDGSLVASITFRTRVE